MQVAWELRRGLGTKPDCSHFVNAIYAQAGLDYDYAKTKDIFDGVDSFRRVHKPQPGDLVVWQGHVGIVVDPDEHSFYSSVMSGFAIEDYRSGYWTSRGQLRFYRYLIDEVHRARLIAHLNALQSKPRAGSVQSISPDDSALSTRSPRSRGDQLPASEASIHSGSSDAQTSDVVLVSSQVRPSKDDVRAALVRLADANSARLPQPARIRLGQSVVVSEQVTVAELNIGDHSGWVELQLREPGSGRGMQTGVATASKWRMSLHRDDRGWIMLVPQDMIYLRRGPAIRALADQVARTSRVPANDLEIKKAVKALDDLLSREAADATAGLH